MSLSFLHSLSNTLAFWFRTCRRENRFREPYQETAEGKEDLFIGRVDGTYWAAQEAFYLEKYQLHTLKAAATRHRYLETLSYLNYLELLLVATDWKTVGQDIHWLDVGVKNWSYAEALYQYLAYLQRDGQIETFHITGVEVDAYRQYTDYYCRKDYAEHYIQSHPCMDYVVSDIRKFTAPQERPYEVISLFFPFVFIEPHLAWGLPGHLFKPQALFEHLWLQLKPTGVLVITNQGEDEALEQERLIKTSKMFPEVIAYTGTQQLPETFYAYQHTHWCHVMEKHALQWLSYGSKQSES